MAAEQYNFEGIPDAPAGGYNFAGIPDVKHETAPQSRPNSSSALFLAGAAKAIPAAEQGAKAALNAPNAPRVIQRAIGAGVRGASTAVGAAIGGVPGAVGGAAMSEGLTPTQQTIRGWLGRPAATAASAAPASDAVVNYIESMGADVNNLKGAALEYAKKAGRAILYDGSGRASLVPLKAAETTTAPATTVAAKGVSVLGKVAKGLNVLSGVQGGLDLAQMADPTREDIGFLGIGHSSNGSSELRAPASQLRAVQYLIDKGASPSDAVKRVSGGVPQLMGPLMGLYMRSKLPK